MLKFWLMRSDSLIRVSSIFQNQVLHKILDFMPLPWIPCRSFRCAMLVSSMISGLLAGSAVKIFDTAERKKG